MIYSTITQKGTSLIVDNTKLPIQYSNDISFRFIKDESYSDYAVIPYVCITDTSVLECATNKYNLQALPIDEDGIFKISNKIMFIDGYLTVAFDLTNEEETIHVGNVVYKVKASIGGVSVLPETSEEWQSVVRAFMNQYVELNVGPQIKSLTDEALRQQEVAVTQQETATSQQDTATSLQNAVDTAIASMNTKLSDGTFIPEHKWEGSVLFFRYSNGDWDSGVNLAMPDKSVTGEKLADVVEIREGQKVSYNGTEIDLTNALFIVK